MQAGYDTPLSLLSHVMPSMATPQSAIDLSTGINGPCSYRGVATSLPDHSSVESWSSAACFLSRETALGIQSYLLRR